MGTVTAQTLRDRQGVTDGDGEGRPGCKAALRTKTVHRGHGGAAADLRQLPGPPTPTGSPTHRLSDSGG